MGKDGIGSLLQGEYQQAEECLTSEMENMGNGASLFTPLLATYYLAMLGYQRGNLKHAADLLEMALDQISHDEGMKGFIGIFHVLYAWVLYDLNRLDECLEHAIAGVAESREWAAQTLNSLVLHRLNHDEASMESLREAIGIAEEHGHIRMLLDEGNDMRTLLRNARKEGIAPSFVARLLRSFPEDKAAAQASLSKREIDVLSRLARGLTPKQIAEEMFVSAGTVRTHLHHIYGKLGVSGQTEAILEAQRQGLV